MQDEPWDFMAIYYDAIDHFGHAFMRYHPPKQDYIDDWDFNWQMNYMFKEPIAVPAGSKVRVVAVYDNSTNNRFNPNSPPKRVTWGEQTTDEMFLLVASYTLDKARAARVRRALVDAANQQEVGAFLDRTCGLVGPVPIADLRPQIRSVLERLRIGELSDEVGARTYLQSSSLGRMPNASASTRDSSAR